VKVKKIAEVVHCTTGDHSYWTVYIFDEPIADEYRLRKTAQSTANRINHHIAEAYAKEGNQ
jgi:hypothetical protein